MSEVVHLDVTEEVATITLDSPHNRNALSRELIAGCRKALDTIDQQETGTPGTVRAIVLTHTDPAFCAGADLKQPGPVDPAPMLEVMRRLMEAPQPTIAAVRGPVRAGGIGLMAACDLVVVRDDVMFAFTEVRIGVAPAIISVPILRRTGASQVATSFLTGAPFDAAEARRIGLVTHVEATDEAVTSTVDALTDGVRHGAPSAVAETKRLLARVPTLSTDDAFAAMATLSADLFASDEAREGIAAFTERRAPRWQPAR